MTAELVPVRMGECRCPGTPHTAGDFAYLKPQADLEVGLAAHQVVNNSVQSTRQNGSSLTAEQALELMQIQLGKAYTIHGIKRWDRLDEHGQPLEINAATVDQLSWSQIKDVADKAAQLYSEEVLIPLVESLSRLSRSGQTNGSTSARKPSTRKRQRP